MAYIDNPNGFYVGGTVSGRPSPEAIYARLDVNQTIKQGDLLIVASGYLQIAISSSVVLIGIAIEPKTASASVYQWIGYIPLLQDLVLIGQCSGTPTIANLLTPCDIEGTTGIMELNENATSYNVAVPIGLLDETEGFGLNARLKFIIKKSIWNISA